ncbi:RDD domain-containing protein [Catenovulum agarivorans DS-2]|uniref:RDD domain-containing protein n=1 Tax=Catenovulum agarivorans DS-2 TaxID=1328313 RepID=W7QAH5_9ALTE|nr:RDD family protein [Catenovulum agarivorans]EWH09016.1 RDD domain-containing protein [Catenovulum agarivorans DS-2]
MSEQTSVNPQPLIKRAGLIRRIGAWVYDGLIIIAIMLLASSVGLAVINGLKSAGLIELGIHGDISEYARNNLIYQVYLACCFIGFYVWFWRRGGQTAGMKTWRLQLRSLNGKQLTHAQCLIRLACSFGGLSNLWVIFPWSGKRALHDIISKTEVVVLSKDQNKHVNWKGYM